MLHNLYFRIFLTPPRKKKINKKSPFLGKCSVKCSDDLHLFRAGEKVGAIKVKKDPRDIKQHDEQYDSGCLVEGLDCTGKVLVCLLIYLIIYCL